jgi:flagellar basal body rod protein FlgG
LPLDKTMTGSVKPSPPTAPNGGALAAGQSYGDVQTAIGNTIMRMRTSKTRMDRSIIRRPAQADHADSYFNAQGAFQGLQSVDVPQFNKTETLTPTGQHLLDQQQQSAPH